MSRRYKKIIINSQFKHLASFIILSTILLINPVNSYSDSPVNFAVPAGEEGLKRFSQWKIIIDHFNQTSGITINLRMVDDHYAIQQGLENRIYDFAFVDPVWYIIMSRIDLCNPVARVVIGNNDSYCSILIVHKDSIIISPGDLPGNCIALTEPFESSAGFFIPLAILEKNNFPVSGYERIIYSDTSLSVLKGVAMGTIDAGFLSSDVLLNESNHDLFEEVRIITESDHIPQWTVISRHDSQPDCESRIKAMLLNLTDSDEGRRILKAAEIDRFIPAYENEYETAETYYNYSGYYFAPTE